MLASQMNDALFDSTRVDILTTGRESGAEYIFRATGSVLKFAGYRVLYMESADDAESENEETPPLPELAKDDALDCLGLSSDQHFTQPPPRFTEATLIRALEEQGIGRPSTYAPILATIMDRDYVQKENNRFTPTRLGIVVTDLLTANFPDIMDVGFTATMEEQLDDVADGEREWEPMLKDFYGPFDLSIDKAMKEAERVPRELLDEQTDEVCEKCESPMVIKSGRYGRFLACTGYPECKNTRPVETEEERALRERVSEDVDEFCEKCERPMVVKTGRNGRFLACSGYPECKNAKPFLVGVDCPECGGDLAERKQRGRNGRIFYGCVNYPECKFAANPLPQPCPDCGKLLVTQGRGRKNARCLDKSADSGDRRRSSKNWKRLPEMDAADWQDLTSRFRDHLVAERGLAPLTVRNYLSDIAPLGDFMSQREIDSFCGPRPPPRASVSRLAPGDWLCSLQRLT